MLTLSLKIESELYNRVTRDRSLPHPTSRNFDSEKWERAFRELSNPLPRDESLAVAAIHYGTELQRLRNTFDDKIFKGMSRRDAMTFSVAFSNREFFVLTEKVLEAKSNAKAGKGVARLDTPEILVSSPQSGSELSPDALAASIVDTLPHCIERAQRLPDITSDAAMELDQDHFKMFSALSIEHSIRDLWQEVLWKGASLTLNGGQLRQVPGQKSLAECELAWTRRIEGIASQGHC